MPARPPRALWRHAASVLPASALVVGLAVAALPASAAPAPSSSIAVSTSVAVQRNAPQLTARRVVTPAKPVRRAAVDRAGLVLRTAASLRGRSYHFGGVGPRWFDCSGYTRFVFRTAVGRSLPHSSAAQYRLSHRIAKSAIRPGDLIFFTHHGHVYHVGIYAGHGLIWHSPHSGDHVRLAAISTSSWVAGRVL
jgi:cell wall-associated NlpC family hydrolase